jgi:PTS system fructose-specific IIC component
MLAVSTGSGFIGGIIAGFLAGYLAKAISKGVKLPPSMEALKPILIIPLFSSLIVGLAMIYLIGKPVAGILAGLTSWLQTMGTANAVLLGAILGGMMCTDMGGPVNKAAYAFGVGLLSTRLTHRWPPSWLPVWCRRWRWVWRPLLPVRNSIKGSRKGAKRRWFWGCALSPKVRFRSRRVTRCVFCHAVSPVAR